MLTLCCGKLVVPAAQDWNLDLVTYPMLIILTFNFVSGWLLQQHKTGTMDLVAYSIHIILTFNAVAC